MKLTAAACKQVQAKDKDYKLSDGKGLYLLVTSTGRKYWRMKYRLGGKERLYSIGVYPDVSLKEARNKAEEARKLVDQGTDPVQMKRAKKPALAAPGNDFQTVAWEWLDKEKHHWSPAHLKKQSSLMENNLIPFLGRMPIEDIKAPVLLNCLRKIENRGALETARRVRQVSGQIFRYAVATGRMDHEPSAALKGALKAPKPNHYAAIIEPKELGNLLLDIDNLEASFTVKTTLQLLPLVLARPGMVRFMEWSEVDFKMKEWLLPKEKMKSSRPFTIPLSNQALSLLREMEPFSDRWQHVFPGERSKTKPISENSLNAALRRLGYSKERVTAHGFRATARTLLDEALECEPHLIEQQLDHAVKDPLGRAYNRTTHLPQRHKMMQKWADYLDDLKEGAGKKSE